MWSNQIRPHFCTPPWVMRRSPQAHITAAGVSQEQKNSKYWNAKSRYESENRMRGWAEKLDLKGDSLRQKQSQQGECVKSDSSDPTSLYLHETESRSQQFLLSVLRNPGQVGSPETSRGNIDWKAKLDEYCIFVTNSLITVYRTTQLDLKQTKYDHFEPFYYCWDLLE